MQSVHVKPRSLGVKHRNIFEDAGSRLEAIFSELLSNSHQKQRELLFVFEKTPQQLLHLVKAELF